MWRAWPGSSSQRRRSLMRARALRQWEIDEGLDPDFLPETRGIREGAWRVNSAPKDLLDRRVEITGPSSTRNMVINALNSGAQVYMTDFEDAHSPAWRPTLEGQGERARRLCGHHQLHQPGGQGVPPQRQHRYSLCQAQGMAPC